MSDPHKILTEMGTKIIERCNDALTPDVLEDCIQAAIKTAADKIEEQLRGRVEKLRLALKPFANLFPDDMKMVRPLDAQLQQWAKLARAALAELEAE